MKHLLHSIHNDLVRTGDINEGSVAMAEERLFRLWNKYKRVTAIAATIAGVTALIYQQPCYLFNTRTQ